MPRPRKPTVVLELSGAFRNHPERRRAREGEPVDNAPLGDPPAYLRKRERELWLELAALLVPGVALASDRAAFGHLVELELKRRRGRILVSERAELHRLLRAFGMTPADRSRVNVPRSSRGVNPFARISSRGGA